MTDRSFGRGRLRMARISLGGVMGAVVAIAVLLAVLIPSTGSPLPSGFPPGLYWSHNLQRSAFVANRFAIVGAVAGAVVLGRSLIGGAAPSRAEWLAIVLAVLGAVKANNDAGDPLDRAMTAMTGGWVEVTGLLLPAFSRSTVGMVVVLACLILLRRSGDRRPSRFRAPLIAALLAAMLWGPLPTLSVWARKPIEDWPGWIDLARLSVGLLYAGAAVAAIRDFCHPRPDGRRRRVTEWAALASWLLLALAWSCKAASGVLDRFSRVLDRLQTSPPRPPAVTVSAIVEIAGPAAGGLALWLGAAAFALAALRILGRELSAHPPAR